MPALVDCIINYHDGFLLLLAATLCAFSSVVVFRILERCKIESGAARTVWFYSASFVLGIGIWCTHFVAMRAYTPGFDLMFEAQPTISSAILGIVTIGFSLHLFLRGRQSNLRLSIVGLMVVVSVSTLHYIGMMGLIIPGKLTLDYIPIFVSLILAAPVATAAFKYHNNRNKIIRAIAPPLLLTLSVCLIHFVGMSAIHIEFSPYNYEAIIIPNEVVTSIASGGMVAVLALGAFSLFFDLNLKARDAVHKERFAYLAEHDALTGLINRDQLNRELDTLIDNDVCETAALYFIDLDRFKEINDLFGHGAGDKILITVADRLRNLSDKGDLIARIGGDEIIVVQKNISRHKATNKAISMIDALCQPTTIDGNELSVGASIGIAMFPDDGRTHQDLIRNADLALYKAKDSGKGTVVAFDEELAAVQRDRWLLQRDLKSAFDRDEFSVVYQPQIHITNGKILGYEVLLRWNHPTRGNVPPMEFIPLAEETGIIEEIGSYVLHKACLDAAKWSEDKNISVNLSPIQVVRGDIVSNVKSALITSGIDPQRLELEITEGVLLKDTERAINILTELKAMGIKIVMDDFGTGYSSLSYLQRFPFDKIKIDKSFISNLESNQQSKAIVRAVCSLAKGLGVPVTAEGVETQEQYDLLQAEKCDSVQGFFTGRPAPIDQYKHNEYIKHIA